LLTLSDEPLYKTVELEDHIETIKRECRKLKKIPKPKDSKSSKDFDFINDNSDVEEIIFDDISEEKKPEEDKEDKKSNINYEGVTIDG
jgi:hypothetical protein